MWRPAIASQLNHADQPRLIPAVLLSGMAGGMGWGIRGQFGHETGAMIAGVLVGFTLVLLFFPRLPSLQAARAVALFVLGISCGGAMTHGQTLGLTQNPSLIGNWAALGWGLFGVFIKGGIWIGLAGSSGNGPWRQALSSVGRTRAAGHAGAAGRGHLVAQPPIRPGTRILPRIYFSADWYWEPAASSTARNAGEDSCWLCWD